MANTKKRTSSTVAKALKIAKKSSSKSTKKAENKRKKAGLLGQLTKDIKKDIKKVASWKVGKGQNYPQSNVWTEKSDKEVVAKPVGYRWTDEGAKKVGKSANSRPTASDVEKYTGKTFRIPRKPNPASEDGSYRYIYQEKRVDKSDLSQKKKFEEGGGVKTQTEISAKKWVDNLVKEYGYDEAYKRMIYNVSGKNPYFRESPFWVTYAWQRFNELDPNKYAKGGGVGKYVKVKINKRSENEFISILDNNGIKNREFVEYDDDGGVEYAVYEVFAEDKKDLDVINNNADIVEYAKGGGVKKIKKFKVGDKVVYAHKGKFGWEDIDEAEQGGYDRGVHEVTEVDYLKGQESIKLNYDNFWVHPNHFDLSDNYAKGGETHEMAHGGETEKGYLVFNYTDNIFATDEVFKTKKEANNFIKDFRKRFEKQGYYRDNNWNKIAPEEIDLLAIPNGFNPYFNKEYGGENAIEYAKGGQIDMNKHIWEGWTVGDFIQELEIPFQYHRKFSSRDEVKAWAMSEQPYYKKYIKEVVDYYWDKNNQKYAKGGTLKSKAKYIPNILVNEIEIEKNGKTIYVDGADTINGLYVKRKVKYADGGETMIMNGKSMAFKANYKPKKGVTQTVFISKDSDDSYSVYDTDEKQIMKLNASEFKKHQMSGELELIKVYSIDKTSLYEMDEKDAVNYFSDQLKSVDIDIMFYHGDVLDVNKSGRKEFDEIVLSDFMTESEFKKETGYDIQDFDQIVDSEGNELEELYGENTYNWSYLGKNDYVFRVYQDTMQDRVFLIVSPHLGGDPRGNYGKAYVKEYDDKDSAIYDFAETLNFTKGVYFEFKDGSTIRFFSQQNSDVHYFEPDGEKHEGMALTLEEYMSSKFKRWEGDEFLNDIIRDFDNEKDIYRKGGRLTDKYKYIPNIYVAAAEVERRGKTTEIDGADIYNGIYVKKGKYKI